ncbi:MAG TPA: glycosyltransferase family 4 protein [Bacteroidales bacterium]
MERKYKIGYLISNDFNDRTKGSGIYYYQSKALEKHLGEIFYIKPSKSALFIVKKIEKIIGKLNYILPRKYLSSHSIFISRLYGRSFTRRIKGLKLDFIFGDKSSKIIAYLKTEIPIIYSTDAFFSCMHNYYPEFTNLSRVSIGEANKVEANAIRNSRFLVVTSDWAARCAVDYYGVRNGNVLINPRGANLEEIPSRMDLDLKKKESLILIFIGVEWVRKGGDVAYETLQYILGQGQKASLIIIGCLPPKHVCDDKNVLTIQYLNKGNATDRKKFFSLLNESDFQILPTRAECAAISVSECSAFGIPSFVTNTGGVAETVKDNINGFRLPLEANGTDFGKAILDVYNNDARYNALRNSTRLYYEEQLNWDVWASRFNEFLGRNLS